MLLDNKALLRILHAYLVIFQTLTRLNSKGPIYIYKCSVKTYIVDNKKIFASVKTKYTIQNISIKLQCQKLLSISCTCLINPLYCIMDNMALHKGQNKCGVDDKCVPMLHGNVICQAYYNFIHN
jgi:hypothetical protein